MNFIFLFCFYYTMRGSIYEDLIFRLRLLVVEANTMHTRLAKALTSFDDFIIYGKCVQIVTEL